MVLKIRITSFVIMGLFCLSPSFSSATATELVLIANTKIILTTVTNARKALATEDDFIRTLSDFDRSSRVKTEQPVSREQFLKFVAEQVLEWTDSDITKLEKVTAGAKEKLARLNVKLSKHILLVKTTGKEEASAAYCRSTNIIVLPRRFLNMPTPQLESVLLHEVFHIVSRNDAELRERLYALIGFKPCNEVAFPTELQSRRITNPDAPQLDFYLEVTHVDKTIAVVPILFASPARWNTQKGGEFFNYLTWKLMAIERADGNWRAMQKNGKPILLDEQDVKNFREQIGKQPGPVLQAEEIMAEYFVKFVEKRGGIPTQVQGSLGTLLVR